MFDVVVLLLTCGLDDTLLKSLIQMSPLLLSVGELDLSHALDQLCQLTSCRTDKAAASAFATFHTIHAKECLFVVVFNRICQILRDESLRTYLDAACAVDAG